MQNFFWPCCCFITYFLASEIYPQLVGKLEDLPFFNIPWGHNNEITKSLSEVS